MITTWSIKWSRINIKKKFLHTLMFSFHIISLIISLGRPFMMTTRTKIDVHAKSMTMEIEDEKVQFNVLEAMKHPTEDHSLFCIDLLSDVMNNFAFGFLDIFSGFFSSLDFSFSNMSYTIFDDKENFKTGDIRTQFH